MALTVDQVKRQASIKQGVMDGSFISARELSTITADGARTLPSIPPEFDKFLHSSYGDRIGMIDYFKLAGKVTNIASTRFGTFSAYAPYQNYQLADNGAGAGIAIAAAGVNITFKLSVDNYVDGVDPLRVDQDIALPVKYVTLGGKVLTSPAWYHIVSRTSAGTASVWTAKPYDNYAVATAVPVGAEIVPGGFGGVRGGKPKGGFTTKDTQNTWNTSLRTHRIDIEEGVVMQEEIFINLPKGLLELAGLDGSMKVQALNPVMSSAAGRQILHNQGVFNKDLEQWFLTGSANTNSVVDTKENGTTANIQSSKGALNYIDERGITAPRTADLSPTDLTVIEEAFRAKGMYAKDIDMYNGPDLNNEMAQTFIDYIKTLNPTGVADSTSITNNFTTMKWGAMNINLHLVETFGDPNSLGAKGFGLSNRGLLIPNEVSNVQVGDDMVTLPNLSLLQCKNSKFDRSYMVKLMNGFTEVDATTVKDWGNMSVLFKAEMGVCAPDVDKIVSLTRAL